MITSNWLATGFLLEQHCERVLKHLFQRFQERRPGRAVDHTVVAAHRDPHAPARRYLAVPHDRLRRDRADRDDARFRWIDHRRELVDFEHPKVGDGEGRPGVLARLQPAAPRLLGEVARFATDFEQRLQVRVADHRRDEPVLHRDRHPEVHLGPITDVIVLKPGVAGAVLREREGGGFDYDVVERDSPAVAHLPVERVARFRGPLHVDLGRQEEVRDGAEGRGEPLGDRLADLGDVAAGTSGDSPGAAITATTFPTGTVCPSVTATCRSTPSARATSSITALSVSTSASVSPVFTASPSRLCHFTRRPSSMVGESASMKTLVAMISRGTARAAPRRPPSRGWAWRGARAVCYRASARPPESLAG